MFYYILADKFPKTCTLNCSFEKFASRFSCLHPEPDYETCGNDAKLDFDNELIKKFALEAHNEFRSKVAAGDYSINATHGLPKATGRGIPDLIWDDQLACTARKLAQQCLFKHYIGGSYIFSWVGQNLWKSSGFIQTEDVVKSAVGSWFSEIKAWNNEGGNVNSFGSSIENKDGFYGRVAHMTQVIWGETSRVGCAVVASRKKGTEVVCNYGQGGNMSGSKIYPTSS